MIARSDKECVFITQSIMSMFVQLSARARDLRSRRDDVKKEITEMVLSDSIVFEPGPLLAEIREKNLGVDWQKAFERMCKKAGLNPTAEVLKAKTHRRRTVTWLWIGDVRNSREV